MDQIYKAQKEAFVSNLTGGDIMEINAVTFIAPVSIQNFVPLS
jgi:glucosaminylphosphatidylinositol acyltransferase